MNMNFSISEPGFVLYISQPPNIVQKMVLYSEYTYGSQFSEEKNGLEIRSLVP